MAVLKSRREALDLWNGSVEYTYDGLQLAALMAIRDELKRLNDVFACSNTIAIPNLLRRIARNTAKKRKIK